WNLKYINHKQREYLLGSHTPRLRQFYLLPKIHKDPTTWSTPNEIPPGRPIVSDCDSESYCTAEYIEYFLSPISRKHPSYLKDTYDFIEKIGKIKIPPNAFLFTMDVDSLYTNIETEAGLRAVQKCFEKYPNPRRPTKQLMELLKINLTKNDFEFDSQFYLQRKGTAMGKKFAPSYANIFMADWEESALASAPLKPLHYYRFLDDIWGIWTYSEEQFLQFAQHLNTHQRSIKTKHVINDTSVNFLDVISFKGTRFQETGQLDFKVYFKSTDTHSLLHKNSYHPRHTFKGIVKSQLLRFYKICNNEKHFMEATTTLFKALRSRGYTRTFLRKAFKQFKQKIPNAKKEDKIIPFVNTFSEMSVQLNLETKANFQKFLSHTPYLKEHKIISAFRRNKNLKDLLVKSKLTPINTKQSKRGTTPKYYETKNWITSHYTKQIFKLKRPLSPQTENCVYIISCHKCAKQYVGQTKNSIRIRMYRHIRNITKEEEKHTHIVNHFIKHDISSLRVTGLESNTHWTLKDRLIAETRWINKLETRFPRGLND
ncbi:GIY-YIG nuclease family protein, partial [Cetobacterium sp.]|uniref:GIY-YIG nuclease family protein n=1 Tax=Cetobacterium sp. TaxID=2071632 RepID=UPI003F35243E